MFQFLNRRWMVLLGVVIYSFGVGAASQEFSYASYKEAKGAPSFLRFDMESTKMGLLTTSFDGAIKRFSLHGDLTPDSLQQGARIEFAVNDIDTDNGSRNDKMWNHCLNGKTHPHLKITLGGALPLNGEKVTIPAVLSLRGYEKPITLSSRGQKTAKGVEFDFSATLSIKDLEIPDPSIVIASVRDTIEVTGHFIVVRP